MGCGASTQSVSPTPVVPPLTLPAAKESGNDNAAEEVGNIPKGSYTEKWPELCDPDQEFNLVDYVFCFPEKSACIGTMLMEPEKKWLTEEDIRTWKYTIDRDWNESKTVKMVAPKTGARDRKCTFEQVEFNGKVAFTSKRFFSVFHITDQGMEFRCRKEPERALLVHRSLDLEGNIFWKSDGHLCDELHESLFTVAKWSAEECTLEVDGREVAKVTADNYVCPDFFLACYFCSRGEPELCDYVLTSAKAQAERDALNKRAMEAFEKKGGRDHLAELRAKRKKEEEEREQEKKAAAVARKAPAATGGSGPPPATRWWVCQKCGWKFTMKPFQGKCTVSRGQTCGGAVVQT